VSAALLAVAGTGIAYAWYVAYPVVANPSAFGYPFQDLVRYGAHWWSYLVPPLAHPALGGLAADVWNRAGVTEGRLEHQVTLGWGFMALAAVAQSAWLRADRRSLSLTAVPLLSIVAAVALACSLAPAPAAERFAIGRPSAWVHQILPMFRSYARFGLVVQLMTVLLAAIGAQHLWASNRKPVRIACGVLLVLAAAEYVVWPSAMSRDALPTAAHRWVVQQPGALRVLDCSPLTTEAESTQWLSAGRVSLRSDAIDECSAPDVAGRLAAERYTHLLVRQGTTEAAWIRARGVPPGLLRTARFRDGEVFTITAPPAPVYTRRLSGFYPREYDGGRSWRWLRADASWEVVNTGRKTVVSAVDIELEAFRQTRRLRILLDGTEVQTLLVASARRVERVGPLVLTPGRHEVRFRPVEGPAVASLAIAGDRRLLSFSFGTWQWIVEGGAP
jgi:hypothetical protein